MADFSVIEYLDEQEVLTQLAEEAAELAQAALKLRRVLVGQNPTPKTEGECRAALLEEVADVELCIFELGFMEEKMEKDSVRITSLKRRRWFERLVNGCGERCGKNA